MKQISTTRVSVHALAILAFSLAAPYGHTETARDEATSVGGKEPQTTVKSWLELQSSGQAASPQAQPLTGPVMDRTHERYLESFTHPVPLYFEHVQPINY